MIVCSEAWPAHQKQVHLEPILICCRSQVLIISYETFRLHAERFKAASACDLLICDEAHRLKNDATLTNKVRQLLSRDGR